MSQDYSYAGPVRTITLERALVMKTGFSRKEAERVFAGKMEMDQFGRVFELVSPKKRTEYKYDSFGNLSQEIHYSNDGKIISQEVSQYGSNGMPVRKDTLNSVGDPVDSIRYSFDSEREMVVEHSPNRIVMRKYDSQGKLTLECVYIEESLDMIINYNYQGDLLTEKIYKDPEDKVIRRFFYEYGERGLPVREKCINSDNVITTHNVYEYENFDKYNWLKRTTFSVKEDSKRVKEIPIEVLYRDVTYHSSVQPEGKEKRGQEIRGQEIRGQEIRGQEIREKSEISETVVPDFRANPKGEPLSESSLYEEPEPPGPAAQNSGFSGEQPSDDLIRTLNEEDISRTDSETNERLDLNQDEETREEIPLKDFSVNETELHFPNGDYRGEVKEGKADGRGTFIYRNGDKYKGNFSEGKFNGSGEMVWTDGRSYSGEFKNGQLHGEGKCRWSNGDLYIGEFKEGKMHGRGLFMWSDGASFEGYFENNRQTKQGMIKDPE